LFVLSQPVRKTDKCEEQIGSINGENIMSNVRLIGIIGLLLTNLAIVFGRFFIATKDPGYVAFFHGATPGIILAGLLNWLLCHLVLSNGGYNWFRLEVAVLSLVSAAVITGIDVCIVQNLLL
jgi:hypothetical protein